MRKSIELSRILQVGMVMTLPFALASCTREERKEEIKTPEETAVPEATPESMAAEPVTVDIESVDSKVEGEATISRVGESLMVSLSLDKLAGEGPFRAQILSGRCEDRKDTVANRAPAPQTGGTGRDTAAGARAGTTPTQAQGQVLATLEPIQLSGATGGAAAEQSGMSHSTVPVSSMHGMMQAYIEVQGTGARTVACGNIDHMDKMMSGATTGAPTTPATPGTQTPGTAPAAPKRP